MKVVHVSIEDCNGAGLCAYRISQSLQQMGIDSKLVVLRKTSNDDMVFPVYQGKSKIVNILLRIANKLNITCIDRIKAQKLGREHHTLYSLPCSYYDLSKFKIIRECDVVHLHWVSNFLDIPSFFSSVHKPIVWTLHDENLFYGMAHYEDQICTDQLEKKYYELKKRYVSAVRNLGIVFLSDYFLKKYQDHEIIKNAEKTVINNSVNCKMFNPKASNGLREQLGYTEQDVIFVFIAAYVHVERKGLAKLRNALERIGNPNYKILAIGNNIKYQNDETTTYVGSITDPNKLAEYISVCDYFVMPSTQEAFAQTPLEAMACGLPAIVFPVSGTDELINDKNGVVCDGFTVENLVDGINKAISSTYDPKLIREDVMSRFSPEIIANKYISFYNTLIAKK